MFHITRDGDRFGYTLSDGSRCGFNFKTEDDAISAATKAARKSDTARIANPHLRQMVVETSKVCRALFGF